MNKKKNISLAINMLMIVVGMSMLTYASVPLYRLFCDVTGFGGTTKEAKTLPDKISKRKIVIRFNADVDQNLPWEFKTEQISEQVQLGEQKLAFYTAENLSTKAVTGHAVYNVVPNKAGIYFNKIECFCFKDQTLQGKQKVHMPVSYFIDPEMENDPQMKDINEITLSYTFFKSKN